MATFIFDGSTNITATKADTVVITANPALFNGVADTTTGGSAFTYSNGNKLTISDATFGNSADQYKNITLAGGTFATGTTANAAVTGVNSALLFNGSAETFTAPNGTAATAGGSASGVVAIFGGIGRADPTDTADTVTIGGKGSFLIYGNAGDDTIQQSASAGQQFDSTSFVTVFGGKGNDTITLNNSAATDTASLKASIAVFGGENSDNITVLNRGTTQIFGGVGAADPNDGADTISFAGGGNVTIYANAGNDTVAVGTGADLDSTTVATVYGGLGIDSVTYNSGTVKTTASLFGGENGDQITVTNVGTTVIYGDTAAADANGGNDTISFTGAGTSTIYAAGGDDTVTVSVNTTSDTNTVTVFGGNGNDSVTLQAAAGGNLSKGSFSITAGAGSDSITLKTDVSATTTANVVVTDFSVGNDKLALTNAGAGAKLTITTVAPATAPATLQSALDQAAGAAGQVNSYGAIVYNGDTYLVHNVLADSTFTVGQDQVIKLTGVTDLGSLATATTVAV